MAKEKSGGSVILRGSAVQGAANAFVQSNLLTGLVTSGTDALVVKQFTFEVPAIVVAAAGNTEIELVVSRASKAAMPNIFDDDILFKHKWTVNVGAGGTYHQQPVVQFVPPYEIVTIEDTLFFDVKTLNCNAAITAYVSLVCQPASVTDSEKVGLLLTRIN